MHSCTVHVHVYVHSCTVHVHVYVLCTSMCVFTHGHVCASVCVFYVLHV